LFIAFDDCWTYYNLDINTGKFSSARKLVFLNSFLDGRSEPVLVVDQERLYLFKNEGNSEIRPPNGKKADFAYQNIFHCSLNVLSLTDVEIEQALLSSRFSLNIHGSATQMHVLNNLVIIGSGFKFAIVDLDQRRLLGVFRARNCVSRVRWIDETLICIEQDAGIHLLDFTGRSSDSTLQSPTPPPLPWVKQNLAVLETDPDGQRNIRLVELTPGSLEYFLQTHFGENWRGVTSMVTQPKIVSRGLDKVIRPTTYVWFRGVKSDLPTVAGSVEFVRSWDSISVASKDSPMFTWMSETEFSISEPPLKKAVNHRKKRRPSDLEELEVAPPPITWAPAGRVEAVALMHTSFSNSKSQPECLFYTMTEAEAHAVFAKLP
jgi:hypothetical protein